MKGKQDLNRRDFLEKKFSTLRNDDNYAVKCLQKDLLDFQEFNKLQVKRLKETQEELVRLVQEAVSESIPDFEAKLYGSHSTNLCLPWSDIDIVLIPTKNNVVFNNNLNLMKGLFNCLSKKAWKKGLKFIDNTNIPLIKITTIDGYNNMQIDISIQDQKHYGIKCVELVKTFLQEYEVLEPLIFALKNILYHSNLNDPYTGGISSYGLILMVVSFLQSEMHVGKSIKINDLGYIFLSFLYYYGFTFDHSKYVIYANNPYDQNSLDDIETINSFVNQNHDIIIIDPLSKSNNVAKSSFQYGNIKMAFMIAFVVAQESCECGCHYQKNIEECIGNQNLLEHCILKRIFLAVKRFNSKESN